MLLRLSLGALVVGASTAPADELVIEFSKTSLQGRAADGSLALEKVKPPRIPPGLPRSLRLPLSTADDGSVRFSLGQEAVDNSVDREPGESMMRVRVVSPGLGTVRDDSGGSLSISMTTALAFENLTTGQARVFDIKVAGDVRSDVAYGSDTPMYIEGWRRTDDGKPVQNATKENRSFWGTLSGRFER